MNWIKNRLKERTTWDGGALIALGLLILFMTPLAKIGAGAFDSMVDGLVAKVTEAVHLRLLQIVGLDHANG